MNNEILRISGMLWLANPLKLGVRVKKAYDLHAENLFNITDLAKFHTYCHKELFLDHSSRDRIAFFLELTD